MNPGEHFTFSDEISPDRVTANSIVSGPAPAAALSLGTPAISEAAPRPAPPPPQPAPPPPPSGGGAGQGAPRGQEPIYRSIDGSGNNLAHGNMNAAGADFVRIGPANFADGVDSMFTNLPNARDISNIVVAGHGDDANPEGL